MEITIQIGFPELAATVEFVDKAMLLDTTDATESNTSSLNNQLIETTTLLLQGETPLRPVELVQHGKNVATEFIAALGTSVEILCESDATLPEDLTTELTLLESSMNSVSCTECYNTNATFCCKICSTVLFDGTHLHSHSQRGPCEHKCTSYFLEEAPAWLPTLPTALAGAC